MIYSVSGTLQFKDEGTAVIDNNGVAFEILISAATSGRLPEPGSAATLFTRMIVREDDIFLVGFMKLDERRLYDSLMTVSGIGPKQGLKILSELTPAEIRNAIITGNDGALSRVKGIGSKTASRIILELKDKMTKIQVGGAGAATSADRRKLETLMALRVLGYNDGESRRAIEDAFGRNPELAGRDVEDIIKAVLATLAK